MSPDAKIKRADLRRQRSETWWAERRRNATTAEERLKVEFDRLWQRLRKSENPDEAAAHLFEELQRLGDRL